MTVPTAPLRLTSKAIPSHCDDDDWADRAKATMKDMGAEDIASSSEASADFAVSNKPSRLG